MRKKQRRQLIIAILGFALFLFGIWGILKYYWEIRTEKLDEFFPADVAIFSEITVNKNTLEELAHLFPEANFLEAVSAFWAKNLHLSLPPESFNWAGKKSGLAFFENGDFMLAVEFRNRSDVEEFLQNFVVEGEKFIIEKTDNLELWVPSFSSKVAFGFHGKWLLVSNTSEVLTNNFKNPEKLKNVEAYKKIKADLPPKTFLSFFVDTQKTVTLISQKQKSAALKPLFETVSQTLPALGIVINPDERGLFVQTKFLSDKKVFNERKIKKDPDQLMPELAQLADKDVLFFMNGVDLHEKYKHTKRFLEQLNPQFALIFEGLLKANFQSVFGEDFDFETQFLALMHSQYAILIDYKDEVYPFLQFSFLTEFGGTDIEQNLSQFHEAIQLAQSKFTTKVEEVELPDGSVRKELVSVEATDVPIQKVDFEEHDYFTVENKASGKKFSYGFVENYFVFSTHEEGLKSIISNKNRTQANLSENEDFRESVLFRYSPSESYGFINMAKFTSAWEFLSATENGFSWRQFLKANIRTATFARKIFPKEIFISMMLFAR